MSSRFQLFRQANDRRELFDVGKEWTHLLEQMRARLSMGVVSRMVMAYDLV